MKRTPAPPRPRLRPAAFGTAATRDAPMREGQAAVAGERKRHSRTRSNRRQSAQVLRNRRCRRPVRWPTLPAARPSRVNMNPLSPFSATAVRSRIARTTAHSIDPADHAGDENRSDDPPRDVPSRSDGFLGSMGRGIEARDCECRQEEPECEKPEERIRSRPDRLISGGQAAEVGERPRAARRRVLARKAAGRP